MSSFRSSTARLSLFLATAMGLVPCASAAQESLVEEIVVEAATPLNDIRAANEARNARVLDGEVLRRQAALDLSELLSRNLAGVFVNEAQSNPLQADVQFRGFVASPLLGLPQGVAVYLDGVRVNEPFGDTVNWGLLPRGALLEVTALPGADPLFGLNALGGTLVLQSRTAATNPGTEIEVAGGSFGRATGELQHGRMLSEELGNFLAASYVREDGWRDFSGTRALRLFDSLTWQRDDLALRADVHYARTDLTGNGAAPRQLLRMDREAIYTHPDVTENRLWLTNLKLDYTPVGDLAVRANVYLRKSDIDTLNGDDSEIEECEDDSGFLCLEDERIADALGQPVPGADHVTGGTVNRTRTEQTGYGFGAQMRWRGEIAGLRHVVLAGINGDWADVDFAGSTELGTLDASRRAIPGGVFLGGSFTGLEVRNNNLGVYVADSVALGERWLLGVSGRLQRTSLKLSDQLGTALDGDHRYDQFNPAVDLRFHGGGGSLYYLRYSQAARVPSPVELTCADPDDPCRLPNAFLADPPLEKIVARTAEAGVRGSGKQFNWHADVFVTNVQDDILFISAGTLTGEGFFDNVGRTRRQGIELGAGGTIGALSWFAEYGYTEVTFRTDFAVSSPNHPLAAGGEIEVASGDRLPLIPRHQFKAGLVLSRSVWALGADVQISSEFHLRGDEGNSDGRIPGHGVLNLFATYNPADRVEVFVNIRNALDKEFATFGLYGEADEVLGDAFDDPRFHSPGAPRGAWLGVRARF